jgi:hypothetical protein
MKHYGPTGRREQPCPDDSVSLEEAIQDRLDELEPSIVAAYAEYAHDKVELPVEMAASLILEMGVRWRWESTRAAIGQRNPWLALALAEIVTSIQGLQKAFIEHHAAQLRSKAEQIKQEAA